MKRLLAPVAGGLAWLFAAGNASAATLTITFAPAAGVPLDGWVTWGAALGIVAIAFYFIRKRTSARMLGLIIAGLSATGALVYGAGQAHAIGSTDVHVTVSPTVVTFTLPSSYNVINDTGAAIFISGTVANNGFTITTNTCLNQTIPAAGTCTINVIGS